MRTERPVAAEPGRVTVRLSAELIYHLASRARRTASGQPPQAQIVTEVALLRSLLDLELRRVPLTVAEAGCLADVLNGALVADALGPLADTEAVDAFTLARQDGGGLSAPTASSTASTSSGCSTGLSESGRQQISHCGTPFSRWDGQLEARRGGLPGGRTANHRAFRRRGLRRRRLTDRRGRAGRARGPLPAAALPARVRRGGVDRADPAAPAARSAAAGPCPRGRPAAG
jgi:hypothetical protein